VKKFKVVVKKTTTRSYTIASLEVNDTEDPVLYAKAKMETMTEQERNTLLSDVKNSSEWFVDTIEEILDCPMD
jgi:hypothetical protein